MLYVLNYLQDTHLVLLLLFAIQHQYETSTHTDKKKEL